VRITEIALSNRVRTYSCPRASSSTRPAGPPPLTAMWLAALGTNASLSSAAVSNTPTFDEPNAATYSRLPSAVTAISSGCARLFSPCPFGPGGQHAP
jgi:hypothetical protein